MNRPGFIQLPDKIDSLSFSNFYSNYYLELISSDIIEITFDWSKVLWVSLPECVKILSWSSHLAQNKSVRWKLADPYSHEKDYDNLNFNMALVLGDTLYKEVKSEIGYIFKIAREKALYPGIHKKSLLSLKTRIKTSKNPRQKELLNWLDLEFRSFKIMDVIGYLDRYNVYERAEETGIIIDPDYHSLLKTNYSQTSETPSMPLSSFRSATDKEEITLLLQDQKNLERILGAYVDMDVVIGGAFSKIIVEELGSNILQHSKAIDAWICTRLVREDDLNAVVATDPDMKSMIKNRTGFLEIIVADNGVGLTAKLSDVLNLDNREYIKKKYPKNKDGVFNPLFLIDYAFDRLSSSKNGFVEILKEQLDDNYSTGVPSGLFWIWNVVRSFGGTLSLQTNNLLCWYDFSNFKKDDLPEFKTNNNPFHGTFFRICLPLFNPQNKKNEKKDDQLIKKYVTEYSSLKHFYKPVIISVQDLMHRPGIVGRRFKNPDKKPTEETVKLLYELKLAYEKLEQEQILILDMRGASAEWTMGVIAPLFRFFLWTNYEGTGGKYCTVLWNVPKKIESLINQSWIDFIEIHKHLDKFRHAAFLIWDDGSTRMFSNSDSYNRLGDAFEELGEQELNNIAPYLTTPTDINNLRQFMNLNTHLFDTLETNKFRFRPWPPSIFREIWRQDLEWFHSKLFKPPKQGGINLSEEGKLFRLPSTGMLKRDFYHFGIILSRLESLIKLGWMIAEIIRTLQRETQNKDLTVVVINRPIIPLIKYLRSNYFDDKLKIILASTLEDLERQIDKEQISGNLVHLTSAIDTGWLCAQLEASLKKYNVNWTKTITLIDRRSDSVPKSEIEIGFITKLKIANETKTGPVISLAAEQQGRKVHLDKEGQKIIAIDPVNLGPVEPPTSLFNEDNSFWNYLERGSDPLMIGHYKSAEYHHYIYYVNVLGLLDLKNKKSNEKLIDVFVNKIKHDLLSSDYDPSQTIIISPPDESSNGEYVAGIVQSVLGIQNRKTIYRDNFAGQWRFSPYVSLVPSIEGYTVIIIDEGSNTGETIMGALHAIIREKPKRILIYCPITRMPPHRLDTLQSIVAFKNVQADISVTFIVILGVPSYLAGNCPICRFREEVSRIHELGFAHAHFAKKILELSRAIIVRGGKVVEEGRAKKLWEFSSDVTCCRLREAFEMHDYHPSSASYVNEILRKATSGQQNDDKEFLDIAFIISTEPDLANVAILGSKSFLYKVLSSTLRAVERCPEDHLLTYCCLMFHLSVKLTRANRKVLCSKIFKEFWKRTLKRNDVTIQTIGIMMTVLLAPVLTEERKGVDSFKRTTFEFWIDALLNLSYEPILFDYSGLKKIFTRFYAKGALAAFAERSIILPIPTEDSLYMEAKGVAEKSWHHSAEAIKGQISNMYELIDKNEDYAEFNEKIISLMQTIIDIQQLQYDLCTLAVEKNNLNIDPFGLKAQWRKERLNRRITEFALFLEQMTDYTSETYKSSKNTLTEKLSDLYLIWKNLTDTLEPAFAELFPKVKDKFDLQVDNFQSISGLPKLILSPEVDERCSDVRVFLPQSILIRFIDIACDNLRTIAFAGLNTNQLIDNASVNFCLEIDDHETETNVVLSIKDNGPTLALEGIVKKPEKGFGVGLKDIKPLLDPFGAKLNILPNENGYFQVKLVMKPYKEIKRGVK